MIVTLLISLIPVFLLLIVLLWLDSFKLARRSLLSFSLLWGAGGALTAWVLNSWLMEWLDMDFRLYSSFVAPLVEELLKCSWILLLIRRNRAGFMIDGAIYGFAAGAAFSMVENLWYVSLYAETGSNIMTWIVRGLGTAVMHGGTPAIFGVFCLGALNRQEDKGTALILGFLAAVSLHALFNSFLIPPLLSTLIIVILIPVLLALLFQRNEKSIRQWLELEFDSEASILRMIRKGEFSGTKPGAFLLSLKNHYPPEIVFDMYCFISLYLELSIRAKSMMMIKESDFIIPHDPMLSNKLAELRALEKSIGRGGMIAIAPVLRMNRKDLWKISLLENTNTAKI